MVMRWPVCSRHKLPILAAYLLLASPPLRAGLESAMVAHMLLQMPLLVATGMVAAVMLPDGLRGRLQACNNNGVPFALLALFAASFWMLPRSLDEALNAWPMEVAKFITLPLLIGLPLALSWRRLSVIGRGLVWSNLISMLVVSGWLYTVAPIRICNNYLVNDQQILGQSLLILAAVIAAALAGRALFGRNGDASGQCAACAG